MREILFKAKRKDNGEWVEGYYCRRKHYCFDNRTDDLQTIIITEFSPNGYVLFEIDESTLCQFTGLYDKNGNKIWENDVVHMPMEDEYFKIEWDSSSCEFSLSNESESFGLGYCVGAELEVIGNVFDNPELLGGADNG